MLQVLDWLLLIIWMGVGIVNLFVRKEIKMTDYVLAWLTVIAFCVTLILNK